MTAEEKQLVLDALSIAEGWWSQKGHKFAPFSEERENCFNIADEFTVLREKLQREEQPCS